MVQITAKAGIPVPVILTRQGVKARKDLESAYNAGVRSFTFKKEIYAAPEVKKALLQVQGTKCCFCESRVTHISDGDVEHFRPKGGTRQTKGSLLRQPGYYWLAYEWDNLFLACSRCNQRNKKNYFPLRNDTKRALSHQDSIKNEGPFFIHPGSEDPEKFLSFKHEWAIAPRNNRRGTMTIDLLDLNRSDLLETRAEQLGDIRPLLDIIHLGLSPSMSKKATVLLQQYQKDLTRADHSFAGMFRAYFRDNPI